MSKLREIVEGHFNEFKSNIGINLSEEQQKVFASRAKVCSTCPLKNGNTCNPRKYINPETLEVSDHSKVGFVPGCGCRLSAKQQSPTSECPAGFWGGEFN